LEDPQNPSACPTPQFALVIGRWEPTWRSISLLPSCQSPLDGEREKQDHSRGVVGHRSSRSSALCRWGVIGRVFRAARDMVPVGEGAEERWIAYLDGSLDRPLQVFSAVVRAVPCFDSGHPLLGTTGESQPTVMRLLRCIESKQVVEGDFLSQRFATRACTVLFIHIYQCLVMAEQLCACG